MKYTGIALVGNRGVGKTPLAEYLEKIFLISRTHCKTMLGEMVTPVMLRMGVPLDEISDRIFGDRINEPLPYPYHHKCARNLLQAAGGGFLDDFGIEGMAHALTHAPEPALRLSESVRRPEEANYLRDVMHYAMVRIDRPGHSANNEHATEVDLTSVAVDGVILNDGTLNELMTAGEKMVEQLLNIRRATRRHVNIVINGRVNAGKDSLTDALREVCKTYGIMFGYMSSIELIHTMCESVNIKTRRKSAEDRGLLRRVKAAMGDWPNTWLYQAAQDLHLEAQGAGKRSLFVTHIREHENIAMLARRTPIYAVWMTRPGRMVSSDAASDSCTADQYSYDIIVNNDGTLEHLRHHAHHVLQQAFSNG